MKSDSDIKKLEECTVAVRDWFTKNGMLLHPEKSEVMLLARKVNADKFACGTGVCVARSETVFSMQLKSLGVTLDRSLCFNQHVSNVVNNPLIR